MSFIDYIKEKLILLVFNLLIFLLLAFFVMLYNKSIMFLVVITLIWIFPIFTFILSDYFKKASFYKKLINNMEALDKKYLLSAVTDEPNFIEGKILYEVLKDTNKSMNENVNKYKYLQREYREYIETWIHEVKTPIASSKLIIENNQNPATLSIKEEIEKIEEFVDQSLFYSRSNSVDRDYIVKAFNIQDAIYTTVKKNSKYFIQNNIKLNIENVSYTVYSDTKWIQFILNQIIINAIKYRASKKPTITVYGKENPNNINIYIVDNGIGIDEKDIPSVFNKGFTGVNGRNFEKSTGMGLYLSKKLAEKLNLNITLSSNEGIGTNVCITFPKSKMMLLES